MAAKTKRPAQAQPQPRREHLREFICLLCADRPVFADPPAFGAHCTEQHPELLEDGRLRGGKRGVMFLDGGDGYTNQFEWRQGDRPFALEMASGPKGR